MRNKDNLYQELGGGLLNKFNIINEVLTNDK